MSRFRVPVPNRRTPNDIGLWLAGVDRSIIDLVPHERKSYAKIGAALLVPFTLGTFGMTVMAHVVTGADGFQLRYLLLGLVWGMIVVTVDRLLISPRYHTRDLRKPAPRGIGTVIAPFVLGTLRVLLAIGLSFLIAEQVVAFVFSAEAEQNALSEAQEGLDADNEAATTRIESTRASQIAALETERETATDELERLQGELTSATDRYADANDKCVNEIDNGNGRRVQGRGPVAEELCAEATRLETELAAIKASNEPRIEATTATLTRISADITAANGEAQGAIDGLPSEPELETLGFWERIERANASVDPVWRWSLSIVLIVLEALAVIAKMLTGSRAYERALAYESSRLYTEMLIEAESATVERRVPRSAAAVLASKAVAPAPGLGPFGASLAPPPPPAADSTANNLPAGQMPLTRPAAASAAISASVPAIPPTTAVGVDPTAEFPAGPAVGSTEIEDEVLVNGKLYRFDERLRFPGGFGEVRSAELVTHNVGDRPLPNGVAIKRPMPDMPFAVDMLSNEIELLGQLQQLQYGPSWVDSTQVSDTDHPILVMEYYPRHSLDEWIGSGRVTVTARLLLGWLHNMADGVEELWDMRRVHGDLKPANVLVVGRAGFDVEFDWPYLPRSTGSLLLCDYGTARQIGTPHTAFTESFGAPEYPQGKPLSPLGDVYSLGATGWWLANLALPGEAVNQQVPPVINELLATWLANDPTMRVPGAASSDLAGALKAQIDEVYAKLQADDAIEVVLHGPSTIGVA